MIFKRKRIKRELQQPSINIVSLLDILTTMVFFLILIAADSPFGVVKTGAQAGGAKEDKQKFSRDDKVIAEWVMLRKEPVKNSTNKTWGEQQGLLSNVERVPNASEVMWGITTYKEVRDILLFPNIYVRTSSVDAGGYHVYVGYSADGGVNVNYYWDDFRRSSVGLASARK